MVEWAEVARYGLIFDAVSGALFMLLGIVVLLQRPHRKVPVLFGLFAVGFGITYVFQNLSDEPLAVIPPEWAWLTVLGALIGVPSILTLAFQFPRRRPGPRPWQTLVAAATVLLSFWGIAYALWNAPIFSPQVLPLVPARIINLASATVITAGMFTALLWAARLPALADALPEKKVKGLLLASLALVYYFAILTGIITTMLVPLQGQGFTAFKATVLAFSGMPMTLTWIILLLRAAFFLEGSLAHWCRNAAIAVAAALPAGAIFAALTDPLLASDLGLMGLTRTIGFVVFAYLVLRNQLLGADVAFKFTLKQSTVAGIFVAVFFAVETIASEWLSDKYGLWLGVGSTAILVFAIHPLQRVGDRVADAAMPNVRPLSERTADERAAMYKDMVEQAWADGTLTRAEGRVLEVARERLGLPMEQAHAIEAQARTA